MIKNTEDVVMKLRLNKILEEEILKTLSCQEIVYKSDLLDFLNTFFNTKYANEEIAYDTYINSLQSLLNIFSLQINVNDLIDRYYFLKSLGIEGCQLKSNHKQILSLFDKLNIFLNENLINYYHTSGFLAYLLTSKRLQRYHHDIDVFIDEKQLHILQRFSVNYGFKFYKQYGTRSDGNTRIMLKMKHESSDIPITIFMYKVENDNSVTQHDFYYQHDELLVEKIFNSKIVTDLSFSNQIHYHNGIGYRAITLEALYLCKEGNRTKDIYDCSKIEDYIDQNKLIDLKNSLGLCKQNKVVKAAKRDAEFFNSVNEEAYNFDNL